MRPIATGADRRGLLTLGLAAAALGLTGCGEGAKAPEASRPVEPPKPPPDYWLDEAATPPKARKVLEALAPASGLARLFLNPEWIGVKPAAPAGAAPQATYTTFMFDGMPDAIRMGPRLALNEVRRFGRLLLAYPLDRQGVAAAQPGWMGFDLSGAHAPRLDGFYGAWRQPTPDVLATGKALAAALPADLEVTAVAASIARELGDVEAAKALMAPFEGQLLLPQAALKQALDQADAALGTPLDGREVLFLASGLMDRRKFLGGFANDKLSANLKTIEAAQASG